MSSQRILYTPSGFARTTLLYLQETGSLHAISAHTSHREHLASYLVFLVTSGSGELEFNGKAIRFGLEIAFLLIAANHIPTQRLRICGHCNGAILWAYYA